MRILYPARIVPGSKVTINKFGKVTISDPNVTTYVNISGDDAIGYLGHNFDMRLAPKVAMLVAGVVGLTFKITKNERDLFQIKLYKIEQDIPLDSPELSNMLSSCAKNRLAEMGIRNLIDLSRCTPERLLSHKAFGRKCYDEVMYCLAKHGLELAPGNPLPPHLRKKIRQ